MSLVPDLAFGNSSVDLLTGITEIESRLKSIVPSWSIRDSRSADFFAAKIAAVQMADLTLVANAVLPSVMEVNDSEGWHLFVPYIGHAEMQIDGRTIPLESGRNALLAPNIRRSSINHRRSAVHMRLDPVRLQHTVEAIVGPEDSSAGVSRMPTVLEFDRAPGLFRTFQLICGMVDTFLAEPQSMEVLGIDDLIYRWIAFGLVGPRQDDDAAKVRGRESGRLDRVCDMIKSTATRTMTLTEMEQVSGLSSRALQYAFRARFGCSPMEWQRRERIGTARDRLLARQSHETITSIAYSLGFSSSAAFAAQYRQYFGETPSQTLRARSA